jgi:hypothetical protein
LDGVAHTWFAGFEISSCISHIGIVLWSLFSVDRVLILLLIVNWCLSSWRLL